MTTSTISPLPMAFRSATPNAALIQQARESLRGNFGNAILLMILQMAPMMPMVLFPFIFAFHPIHALLPFMMVFNHIVNNLYGLLWAPFFNIFFYSYCLACLRKEPVRLRAVFNGMPGYWRTVIFSFLLALLIMVCVFGCVLVLAGTLGLIGYFIGAPQAFILLAVVGAMLATAAYCWLLLALFPIYFLFIDAPARGVIATVRASFYLMDGYKWKAFGLCCRFIGWFLLMAFTFGLAGLFVMPYFATACAAFYEDIRPRPLEPPPLPQAEAAPVAY